MLLVGWTDRNVLRFKSYGPRFGSQGLAGQWEWGCAGAQPYLGARMNPAT